MSDKKDYPPNPEWSHAQGDKKKYRVWDHTHNTWATDEIYLSPDGRLVWNYSDSMEPAQNCEVVMCTGLKDKNGVLIFEGDLLLSDKGVMREVYWNNLTAEFSTRDKDRPIISVWAISGGEIIGNVYQNPELLEG